SFPRVRRSRAVRLQHKNAGVTLHECFVALAVRCEPDAGLQTKTLDVRGETVHAAREAFVYRGPVAVFTETVARALPAIVDLNVLHAEVFEVLRDPLRGQLDLVFVDLLVEEVPGTPTRRREWKARFVD